MKFLRCEKINGDYKGMFVLWLLGPTSSGKTTIATELSINLRMKKIPVIHYDGDEVRNFFGDCIEFSTEDRLLVVNTIIYLATKTIDVGFNVVVSALTASQNARKLVRDSFKQLILGYVKCSIEECIRRDPKGLYSKAQKGEIDTLIGYNDEYSVPKNVDMVLDTELHSPKEITFQLETFLIKNWFIDNLAQSRLVKGES